MKIIMSLTEVAALAGLTKEVEEIINPDKEKETVQEMMKVFLDNFKEDERYGFVTMKLDASMNIVIDADPEAVVRVMELIKKYFVTLFPIVKLLVETGGNFANDLQNIVEDYKKKEDEKEDLLKVTVIKMITPQKEDNKKYDTPSFVPYTEVMRGPYPNHKKAYQCPMCGRTAMIKHNNSNHKCRHCGTQMIAMFM